MYDELVDLAMRFGIDNEIYRANLSVILSKYEICEKVTDLTVCSEDQNMRFVHMFFVAKKTKGLSQRTMETYQKTIRRFLAWSGKYIPEITTDDVNLYFANMTLQGKSAVNRNNERRNLSSFFNWLFANEKIPHNPMNAVTGFKIEKRQKPSLTEYEIERLRSACRDERETMVFEVLLSTGCRVTEFVNIKLSDFVDESKIRVIGKGNKERYVYLNAKALIAVEKYISARSDSSNWLVPRMVSVANMKKTGKRPDHSVWKEPDNVVESLHADKSTVEAWIRKLGERAGVEKVHPHKLRRTCATSALKRGMPLIFVSRMLGHSSVDTTQIYLHTTDEELRMAHKQYVL